jgi:hypothetical protein
VQGYRRGDYVDKDWYRFLVHKLIAGCKESSDIFKNAVTFVTFNYDKSLEYYLFQALSSNDVFTEADVEAFLQEMRIVHVYGSISSTIPRESDFSDDDYSTSQMLGDAFHDPLDVDAEFSSRKAFLDKCLLASESLRLIDPQEKDREDDSISMAKEWISAAKVVYILGYGFDENNNRRIGIDVSLQESTAGRKCIMFTNYTNMNTINKKASSLFRKGTRDFLNGFIFGDPNSFYTEKSIHNVYKAFLMDFDSPEDRPNR